MTRPPLLDLCSGSGGCAVGYHRAGFDVTCVDNVPHADNPFPLIVADALEVLRDAAFLSRFEAIHASFPCPRWSISGNATGNADKHPDLITPGRPLLQAWGGPYVMENVPGAPLVDPVLICGRAMGLQRIKRHRLFESNVFLTSPGCACDGTPAISVFGHAGDERGRDGVRRHVPIAEVRRLMGVEWMTDREDVADAIPPVYTEYIGAQLLDALVAA